jgi:hypothetical protein
MMSIQLSIHLLLVEGVLSVFERWDLLSGDAGNDSADVRDDSGVSALLPDHCAESGNSVAQPFRCS